MAVNFIERSGDARTDRRLRPFSYLAVVTSPQAHNTYVEGAHFYQPPRVLPHEKYRDVKTDPLGEDWTAKLAYRYEDLARTGSLSRMSYTFSPTLAIDFQRINPRLAELYAENLATNGMGSSFVHTILPDLPHDDKVINIKAGIEFFRNLSGAHPSVFHTPETALDVDTLEILAQANIEAVACAPWQTYPITDKDDYGTHYPEDLPKLLTLPSGRNIIAIPYQKDVSDQLSFGPKDNADEVAERVIKPKLNGRTLFTHKDGETYPIHWKKPNGEYNQGEMFISHLLQVALRDHVIPINRIDVSNMVPGRLVERSAWSCHCGNLNRWNGSCQCHDDVFGGDWERKARELAWKAPYARANRELNQMVTDVVRPRVGGDFVNALVADFERAYRNPGIAANGDSRLSMESAKVMAIVANTSCATFFEDIGTSGLINIAFGGLSLRYLHEAGLGQEAARIESRYREQLAGVELPKTRQTARDLYDGMYAPVAE